MENRALRSLPSDHPLFSQVDPQWIKSQQPVRQQRETVEPGTDTEPEASATNPVSGDDASGHAKKLLRRAKRLLDREQFGQALPLYLEALEFVPGHKNALFGAGVCSALMGKWEAGHQLLEKAVEQGHEDAEAMLVFCRRELAVPPALRDQVHCLQSSFAIPVLPCDLGNELRAIRDSGPLTQEQASSLTAQGLAEYLQVAREIFYVVGEERFVRLGKSLGPRFRKYILKNYREVSRDGL
jgi:tetratricopeptide (TPR) repeat protein